MIDSIRLLIVDDEVRFLHTLKQRLELRGFSVTAATNGAEAIEHAERVGFELALVDLKMPGLDGDEVLKALKKHDPQIEVIILTGHGSIDSAVDCTRAGSYDYLQKPCKTESLLEVLKDAYQKRVQTRLQLSKEKIDQLLDIATGEPPLEIIRRLRELERDSRR